MLNVPVALTLRRFFGVSTFFIAAALALSVPSFAVYYNIGMFWKGTAGAVTTFTERRFALGDYHGCVVISDGTVKCWGLNSGQVGDGTNTTRNTPVAVSGLTSAVSVAGGSLHSCALLSDGTAKCWGQNSNGGLGNGTTTASFTPVTVSGLSGAVSITAGNSHSCSALSDGTARCWGLNTNGQLGDGTTTSSSTPVTVSGLSGVISITAGFTHTCAVLSDGTARCWGLNTNGRLGNGTTTNSSTPVTVSGLVSAISITAGESQSCAILSDGTAKCWGGNSFSEVGDGTTTQRTTPISVTGLTGVVSVTAGEYHSCAVLSNGTAKCWGNNTYGQIGDGTVSARSTPVTVSGLSDVVSIDAGWAQSCGGLSDGTVKCWGLNNNAQLGNGTTTNSSTYVSVTGSSTGPFTTVLSDAISIAVGGSNKCVALSDGTAKCWGDLEGQTLNGAVYVTANPYASSGMSHSCALLSNGTVQCWGYNGYGELGGNGNTDSSTPITVGGISGAIALASGRYHNCAVISDGTVKCWGFNDAGQLGDGSTSNRSTPVTVTGLIDAISIAASGGVDHTCAVISDGTAKCWGYNYYGQLGNGTTTSSSTPVTVTGLSNAVSITCGADHSCALLSNGAVKCWGGPSKLGNGSSGSTTPVTASVSEVISISAGYCHTCAVLSSGGAKCWGCGSSGQLGDGANTWRSTPVTVAGLSGAVSIATGGTGGSDHNSCALLANGTVKCWGGGSSTPTTVVKWIEAVASSTASNAGGAIDLVITKPTGTITDHVMVAGITTRPSTTTITTPSGWTLLQSQSTGNISQSIYYRVVTSADDSATDYTWTLSVSSKATGVIIAYKNVDTTAPILTSDGLATAASATITAPSLTTTETDYQSVIFFGVASDNAITGPSVYTTVGDIGSSGGGGATTKVRTYAAHSRYIAAGTIPAQTGSVTAVDNVGQHLLLKRAQ